MSERALRAFALFVAQKPIGPCVWCDEQVFPFNALPGHGAPAHLDCREAATDPFADEEATP